MAPGANISVLDFEWNDGWFIALGGEWDYASRLTLRAGAAYEISPIRNATQRKINVADSDRVWLSAGDSPGSITTPVRRFTGSAQQSADIISLSMEIEVVKRRPRLPNDKQKNERRTRRGRRSHFLGRFGQLPNDDPDIQLAEPLMPS